MKLIIDIDETIFKRARYEYYGENEVNHSLVNEILISVINGTVLPKGHGRIIDESQVTGTFIWDNGYIECYAPTIIDADKETDDYYKGAQEEY